MTLPEKALALATRAHEGMRRKDGPPYIMHPMAVASILIEEGFLDTAIAAAYVHDTLEDTDVTEDELRAALGEEVLSIVKAVTEDKSLPWEERKASYMASVRAASIEAKAVSLADKIHNLESLLALHRERGAAAWNIFNRGREKKQWFEESMLTMFKESWDHPLVKRYEALVEKMRALKD